MRTNEARSEERQIIHVAAVHLLPLMVILGAIVAFVVLATKGDRSGMMFCAAIVAALTILVKLK